MVKSIKDTAFFVKQPRIIEDLNFPLSFESKKKFVIEKTIELSDIEYENFITDLRVERYFIEENAHLCYIDEKDVYHCILIKEFNNSGILVQSDKSSFSKYVALYKK